MLPFILLSRQLASLKAANYDKVKHLKQGRVTAISKEHFTSLYSHARSKAFTQRNIKSGCSPCRLFPFILDKVF